MGMPLRGSGSALPPSDTVREAALPPAAAAVGKGAARGGACLAAAAATERWYSVWPRRTPKHWKGGWRGSRGGIEGGHGGRHEHMGAACGPGSSQITGEREAGDSCMHMVPVCMAKGEDAAD